MPACAAPTVLYGDPLADVWIAIRQRNAGRFALSEKNDAILTGQSHIFEVQSDAAAFPFRADQGFQFGNVFFGNPAADGKDHVGLCLPVYS